MQHLERELLGPLLSTASDIGPRTRIVVFAASAALCSCSSKGDAQPALTGEQAKQVEALKERIRVAFSQPEDDPTSLPRCPRADDAMLLDRASIAYLVDQGGKAPVIKTVEAMQTQMDCSSYLAGVLRQAKAGTLRPGDVEGLKRFENGTPAFCYWREETPSEFSGCGAPDRSGYAQCSTFKPGRSVIDVVRHPKDGPACANRILVDHTPRGDDQSRAARDVGTFLSRYFEGNGSKVDVCDLIAGRDAYRIKVDDVTICDVQGFKLP